MQRLAEFASVAAVSAALAQPTLAQPAFAQTVVKLETGGAQVIESPLPIAKVVIDKPGVVTPALKDRRHLLLSAVQPGETGVKLIPVGHGEPAAYEVQVAPSGQAAARALAALLHAQPGLDGIEVAPSPKGLVLTGEVKDVETHARLTRLAAAQSTLPVTDMVAVTGGQMVAVDIRFYAVDSNTLKELGFNFSYLGGDIQGGLLAPSSLQTYALNAPGQPGLDITATTPLQNAFNLLLAKPKNGALGVLSALNNAGLSQVLAQPTLLVRSGESADFLAGGDVPVPVPQAGVQAGAVTIQYRPYGVKLTVSPIVLSDKRILLKLAPEVSELDYANGVQIQGSSVPGFRRRSAATTVELGDGQSFVIAGLTYMTGSSTESRLPGLDDLPVIGALFKTSQVTRQRQELIVVATPRLVAPLDRDPLDGAKAEAGTASMGDIMLGKATAKAEISELGLTK